MAPVAIAILGIVCAAATAAAAALLLVMMATMRERRRSGGIDCSPNKAESRKSCRDLVLIEYPVIYVVRILFTQPFLGLECEKSPGCRPRWTRPFVPKTAGSSLGRRCDVMILLISSSFHSFFVIRNSLDSSLVKVVSLVTQY